MCEGEVALVMGRHRHHRALAVAHQDVVGDVDRHCFVGEGVIDPDAGVHALLFHGRQIGLCHAALFALGDELGQSRVAGGGPSRQRVLGGDGNIGDAIQGVGAGGEYLEYLATGLVPLVEREVNFHAEALADPVSLHGLDPLGPARQVVQAAQQLLGVVGDAEEIHRNIALFHQGAASPATAVDDLLVGQHSMIDRVPVHRRHLLVDHALLKQPGEQPLFPAVVIRFAGSQLALPIDPQAQAFQLPAHVVDIGVGPAGRGDIVGDGGVLGR